MCGADAVENVLRDFPQLRLCIPHLGADEYDEYAKLLERYDNLWLDTTVALAEFLPLPTPHFFVAPTRPHPLREATSRTSPTPGTASWWRLRNFGLTEDGLEWICGKDGGELLRRTEAHVPRADG